MNSLCHPRLALFTAFFFLPVLAALELAPPFTDHAVLQRDVAVPVWGWDDDPGATVTISFGGQRKETRVNLSGVWRAELDPMPANATGADLVVSRGSMTITLHDLVVGEVWLASGQSNMEWPVRSTSSYAEEQAKPANPLIRHLYVVHSPSDLPTVRVKTHGWQSAAPDTLGHFSAVGYFFAEQVAGKLQVPVGIINSSWGATPVESWMPEPVLRSTRAWPDYNRTWQESVKVFPEKLAAQPALEAAWNQAQEDFRTMGKPITMPWPRPPTGPGTQFAPAGLYNGMIFPLAPYALRGALWYQGEGNAGRPGEYAELFPAMIAAWRATWPLGDFPFLYVQLASFTGTNDAQGTNWAHLREAQEAALHLPATGQAVAFDNENPKDIHPVNKRPIGERLARIALHRVYDQRDTIWSGPIFQSLVREGAALRVHFSHAAGLRSMTSEITGFEVSGADKVFHAATVKIDGSSVLVRSPAVLEPIAVRYAFRNAPAVSLFNAAGLPAAPFRTDDW